VVSLSDIVQERVFMSCMSVIWHLKVNHISFWVDIWKNHSTAV